MGFRVQRLCITQGNSVEQSTKYSLCFSNLPVVSVLSPGGGGSTRIDNIWGRTGNHLGGKNILFSLVYYICFNTMTSMVLQPHLWWYCNDYNDLALALAATPAAPAAAGRGFLTQAFTVGVYHPLNSFVCGFLVLGKICFGSRLLATKVTWEVWCFFSALVVRWHHLSTAPTLLLTRSFLWRRHTEVSEFWAGRSQVLNVLLA